MMKTHSSLLLPSLFCIGSLLLASCGGGGGGGGGGNKPAVSPNTEKIEQGLAPSSLEGVQGSFYNEALGETWHFRFTTPTEVILSCSNGTMNDVTNTSYTYKFVNEHFGEAILTEASSSTGERRYSSIILGMNFHQNLYADGYARWGNILNAAGEVVSPAGQQTPATFNFTR